MQENTLRQNVLTMLKPLGLPPQRVTTRYVAEALLLYGHGGNYTRLLGKALYPVIAARFGVTPAAIEKGIRVAVQQIQKQPTAAFRARFDFWHGQRITSARFLDVMGAAIREKWAAQGLALKPLDK